MSDRATHGISVPTETNVPTSKQRKPWQFQPGNPGRKKGSRNKLSEDFLKALAKSFEEQGEDAIKRVIEDKPEVYLSVIAKIVPKEMTLNVNVLDEFAQFMASRGRDEPQGIKRIN